MRGHTAACCKEEAAGRDAQPTLLLLPPSTCPCRPCFPPASPIPNSDWRQLHDAGAAGDSSRGMRALMGAGNATAMHVLVDNRLGVEAAMELDFGDRL